MRSAKTGWGELASHICPVSCEQMQTRHLLVSRAGGCVGEESIVSKVTTRHQAISGSGAEGCARHAAHSIRQLREGVLSTPVLARELAEYVRTRLSAHEYPRQIEFIQALPMTTTGLLNQSTQHWYTGSTRKRAISACLGHRVYESHVD